MVYRLKKVENHCSTCKISNWHIHLQDQLLTYVHLLQRAAKKIYRKYEHSEGNSYALKQRKVAGNNTGYSTLGKTKIG